MVMAKTRLKYLLKPSRIFSLLSKIILEESQDFHK
jgi:hypothetical protein